MPSSQLPYWADEWAPPNTRHCGRRAVICDGWGTRNVVCAVTGRNVEVCDGTLAGATQ